jgi:hypothetical protein
MPSAPADESIGLGFLFVELTRHFLKKKSNVNGGKKIDATQTPPSRVPNAKRLVGEKRLYLPPRASSDARTFFASVDVVMGEYCDRDSCSLLGLSLFFV